MIFHRTDVLGLYNVPMGKFHTKDNVCAMDMFTTIENAEVAQPAVNPTLPRTPVTVWQASPLTHSTTDVLAYAQATKCGEIIDVNASAGMPDTTMCADNVPKAPTPTVLVLHVSVLARTLCTFKIATCVENVGPTQPPILTNQPVSASLDISYKEMAAFLANNASSTRTLSTETANASTDLSGLVPPVLRPVELTSIMMAKIVSVRKDMLD